jgi:hypothetical protein
MIKQPSSRPRRHTLPDATRNNVNDRNSDVLERFKIREICAAWGLKDGKWVVMKELTALIQYNF